MRFGAHLPLIDFGDGAVDLAALQRYVDVARDGGFAAIGANDHLVFQRPWLDGLTALAAVLDRSADLTLATTIALPVVRGPVPLGRAAAALDLLSGGRLVLGVGPGSSAADYDAVGIPFEERWPRFDEAVRQLRQHLSGPPARTIPVWIGSWGSAVGLKRVARLGDGWIASAYNTTPERLATGRDSLHGALREAGRDVADFPVVLATMWTHVTDDSAEARAHLDVLASMLQRDPDDLAAQVLIGPPAACAEKLDHYAAAGVDTVFIWPLGDPATQLLRFGAEVATRVR